MISVDIQTLEYRAGETVAVCIHLLLVDWQYLLKK